MRTCRSRGPRAVCRAAPTGVPGATSTFPPWPPHSPGGCRCWGEVVPCGAHTRPPEQHAHTQTHTCTRTHVLVPTRRPSTSAPRGLHCTAASGPFRHVRLEAGRAPCPPLLDPAQPLPAEVTGGTVLRRMLRALCPAASCGPCHCGTPARGRRLRGRDVSPRLCGQPLGL